MDFADSLTPENMARWNNAVIAETGAVDNITGEKKEIYSHRLRPLRYCVGYIGMSNDDFCKCTFGEFESICKAWHEMTEGQNRDAWERARTVAAIAIQPHVKKKITSRQLLSLPWDKKKAIPDVSHRSSLPRNSEKDLRKSRTD